jgi:glycosyltransferase involved in cell wall biosynthesis
MSSSVFSISVVIPAFNVQDYIAEAIESVLKQNKRPDEVIIVNDGSTDETRSIISNYEFDSIVRVIDIENCGLGPARNTGLENSSSEYVYFFDSDDVMADRFVEVIASVVEANKKPDMIVFSGESFCEKGSEFSFAPPDYKRKVEGKFKSGPKLYRELLKHNSMVSSAGLYVTRRDVWFKSGLRFKPVIHEDEDILLPLYFAVGRCNSIFDVLFYRRVRADSIMTSGVTYRNVQGIKQALKTLLCLRKNKPELVLENHDLWLTRTRSMLVAVFARSIQSGRLLPDYFMISVLFRFISLRVLMSIVKQYLLAGKRLLAKI